MQSFNNPKLSRYADLVESDDDRPNSSNILFPCSNEYSSDYDTKAVDISGEFENLYGLCQSIVLWFDGSYLRSKKLANKRRC